jgi:hypothetical protein
MRRRPLDGIAGRCAWPRVWMRVSERSRAPLRGAGGDTCAGASGAGGGAPARAQRGAAAARMASRFGMCCADMAHALPSFLPSGADHGDPARAGALTRPRMTAAALALTSLLSFPSVFSSAGGGCGWSGGSRRRKRLWRKALHPLRYAANTPVHTRTRLCTHCYSLLRHHTHSSRAHAWAQTCASVRHDCAFGP